MLESVSTWLNDQFGPLSRKHGVPGATVAVSVADEVVDAATGLLSLRTQVATAPDSVFQIGSITKVWTATLAMQLVAEGALDLDAPVCEYTPEFRTRDKSASAAITSRHLLAHTAGFEGDVFVDTGRGDDALERFVGVLRDVEQVTAPGEIFSYCNAGYSLLGRVIEVLRGQQFDEVLMQRLAVPLGLSHCSPTSEQAILHRAAVGHIRPQGEGPLTASDVWSLTRSGAPAGSMLAMSASDLVRFAQMHIADGHSMDGSVVLPKDGVRAMREPQVDVPYLGGNTTARGLGWAIYDLPGGTVLGHDGGTIGQYAFLRVVPDKRLAVALLTNGGDVGPLFDDIYRHLFDELAGISFPEPATPPGLAMPPLKRYLGRYDASLSTYEVSTDGEGRLWVVATPLGVATTLGIAVQRYELVPLGGDTFLRADKVNGLHEPHHFLGEDGKGRARLLHTGRINRRVEEM